jgi:hypothetical protein
LSCGGGIEGFAMPYKPDLRKEDGFFICSGGKVSLGFAASIALDPQIRQRLSDNSDKMNGVMSSVISFSGSSASKMALSLL